MVRKLALAVSIALGTLSVPAHALGLGELVSKSNLNQNFKGDITLLSVQPEELDTIRVKLADAEAFSRAGVERPFYLSLLKFEPALSGTGKPVVQVTSEFPIREPFLNFLIEVNWPNGRLLREYTVLLDPPTTTTRRPPKVTPAARPAPPPKPAAVAAPAARPAAPVPVVAAPGPSEYGPVQANDTAWSLAKKLRPDGVSMEQMMMALLAANPEAFVDGNINRLRRGRILRVPSLAEIQETSRQEARAAYRQQQDQWLASKDQKLRAAAAAKAKSETADSVRPGGAAAEATEDQLRIATARPEGEGEAGAGEDDASTPTSGDLKSSLIVARENAETSRQEAETLRSQVDDLEQRLQDMQRLLSLKDEQLARLQDQVVKEQTPSSDDVVAGDEAGAGEAAETAVDAEMAGDAVADEKAADEAVMDVIDRAIAAAEAKAAMESGDVAAKPPTWVPPPGYSLPDLGTRVDPDAVVEGRVAAAPAPAVGIEDLPVEVETVAEQAAAAAEPAAESVADMAGEVVIEGDAPASAAEVVIETTEVVTGQEAAPTPDAVAAPAAPVEETPPEPVAADAPAPAMEPVAEAGDDAKSSLLPPQLAAVIEKNILPIGLGGVALLGLLGWLFTRGRRKDGGPEAAVVAGAAAAATAVDEPAVAGDTLNDLPDSSFLDEFSPDDLNALQDETGEVDPVSEADVYIAYGRYQQAEELLRQALGREPDRLALKHKLLEVHYATRDPEAFSSLAQEMANAGQDAVDEDAWVRALDMGRELAPAYPLFASMEETVAAVEPVEEAQAGGGTVDQDTLTLEGLDMSDLADEYDVSKDAEPLDAPSEVSITLDLEDEALDQAPATQSLAEDLPETLSLDDVESLDFVLPDAEKADDVGRSDVDDITDSLDLDSMMAQAEAAVDADSSEKALDSEFSADDLQAQLDELSDLSVLDSESNENAPTADEPAGDLGLLAEDQAAPEDALDAPLSLDRALDDVEPEYAAQDTIELDDLALQGEGEDDVGTKLDLARAYVDMGDDEGARSILDEVLSEGNASQKGEAEKLLAQL